MGTGCDELPAPPQLTGYQTRAPVTKTPSLQRHCPLSPRLGVGWWQSRSADRDLPIGVSSSPHGRTVKPVSPLSPCRLR